MIVKCGRTTTDGAGFVCTCDNAVGHPGPHRYHWRDADGTRRLWLQWRYEKDGHAVFPGTPGAVDVSHLHGEPV